MNKFRLISVFVVLAMVFSFANVSPAGAVGAPALQLKAADYNPATGVWTAAVGTNISASAISLTARPSLVAGQTPNGSSVVRFDGDDYLTLSQWIYIANGYGAGRFTVFVYVRQAATAGNAGFLSGVSWSPTYWANGGKPVVGGQAAFTIGQANTALSTTDFSNINVTVGAGPTTDRLSAAFRLNGSDDGSGSCPSSCGFFYGGTIRNIAQWNGDIAEIRVYNSVLTAAEIAAVEAELDAAYNQSPDSTPPVATATQSPSANGLGWNNTDVTVTWNWSDEAGGSGIDNASCTTSSTSTGEGEVTLTATCKDLAGNEGSASYTVNIDQTLPVADAGSDQSIHAGYTVNLDGGASSDDNTIPEELSYSWSFFSTPAGNTASLNNADTATPSFTPNVSGEYVAQLIVTDDADNDSEPVFVTLSSLNMAPTGDATATPMLPILGQAVSLDGSASSDPDGDAIYYQWTVTSKPVGSAAFLTNATSATASITPDVSGTYELTLTVSDFLEAGTPVTVSFVASTAEEFSQMQIINVSTVVVALEPAEITTAGNQEAFGNFLTNTMSQIQKGNLNKAIADLERAIARTDGCALRGSPDGNGPGMDWVTTCSAQASIYNSLVEALQVLLD